MSRVRGTATALWLAVVAAAVAAVVLGGMHAAAEFDPLAREHAGIMAQLFAERMDDAADSREQERVTNADTAHFAGGFDGGFGPAAMTEVSAGTRQQSAAEILAQTQAQIDAANHLRGRTNALALSRAGAGAGAGARTRAGTRTRAGHRMRHRMRFGQRHVARHWVADRLKAEARAQMRANAGTGWPEFEGGDNEGKSQSEAVAEVVEAASSAGMSVDDIPLLPDSWVGWFAYKAPDSKRRIRGRLTYDFNLRKMQVDYFPGGLARETYFFDYQKQVRLLYKMIGSVDPTRRSYKKALKKQQDRRKAEEEAAEKGEELPPLAAGSNAMHQEDMLVLDNEDYTWKECTSWDLVEPYQSMCPTNCFSLVQDPSVASIPNNPVSDDGGTLDPYQEEGEKVVYLFLTGHIPAVKEGEDDEESGAKAFVHPPLHLRYSAMRNNTPTEIQIGKSEWRFFRWTDLSEWDNFDLKDSGVIEALAKPDLDCIYAGSFDKDVEEMIQPKIPIILVKPPGAEDEEE